MRPQRPARRFGSKISCGSDQSNDEIRPGALLPCSPAPAFRSRTASPSASSTTRPGGYVDEIRQRPRYRRSTSPVCLPASMRTLTRLLLLRPRRPDLADRPPRRPHRARPPRRHTISQAWCRFGLDEFTGQVLDAAIRPEPPAADHTQSTPPGGRGGRRGGAAPRPRRY